MAGTELAKAYVQIIPSADGIKGKLTSALSGEASSAGDSAGKTAGARLGSSIKKVIAAAGIGTVLKNALTEGSDLQQLKGGVQKIFDEMDTATIMADATNAYKDLNMSANQYLATINDVGATFAASMGDEKGYSVAKAGLQAISDYASGTGKNVDLLSEKFTMITRSTSSYQSIADQFSGILPATSASFLEQAQAAGFLSGEYKKLTEVPVDEYQQAVSEMLKKGTEELGLTGNTAAETATTFAGSLAAMKAAVSNFLGNLSLGEDIKPSMDALIKSTGTFLFNNLLPMFGNILTGLVDYIVDTAVNTDWMSVITQMLTAIKDALVVGIETYFGADASVLNGVFDSFINNIPVIAQTIQDAFAVLWEGVKYIWDTVGVPIFDAIMSVVQFVSDNWGTISGLFKEYFQILWDSCSVFWESIGKPIWDAIGFAIGEVQGIFAEYMPLILEFAQNAMAGIKDTWEKHLKPCFEAIGNFLNTVLKPAFEFVFDTIIKPLIENVFDTIKNLWNHTLKPVFDGICDFLTGVFTADWETAMGGIRKIVEGAFLAVRDIVEGIIGFFDDAIGKIKEFLGFTNEANGVEVTTTTTTTTTGGVEKYASGAVLTRATAFGYNPFTGKTMIGGEAGAEAIAPIDVLQGYVRQAVAEQNREMYIVFNRMVELLENYMPEIAANSHKQIVMNNGVLVAELAPGIDRELGGIASWKGRGNR